MPARVSRRINPRRHAEQSKSPCRRWRCRRRSWRRSRATRKSSTAPAPSSTTTAPTSPSTPTGRWCRFEDAPFEIIDGDRGTNYPKKEDFSPSGYCLFLNTKNVRSDGFSFSEMEFISKEKDESLRKGKLRRGDVVLTTRGTIGNTGFYDDSVAFDHIRINSGMLILPTRCDATGGQLPLPLSSNQENFRTQREAIVSGAAQPQLPIRSLNEATIPLAPLATQQAIVAEIEAEQALVAANRELITRLTKRSKPPSPASGATNLSRKPGSERESWHIASARAPRGLSQVQFSTHRCLHDRRQAVKPQKLGTEARAFCSFAAFSRASYSAAAGSSTRTVIPAGRSQSVVPSLRCHFFSPVASDIVFRKRRPGILSLETFGFVISTRVQEVPAGVFAAAIASSS